MWVSLISIEKERMTTRFARKMKDACVVVLAKEWGRWVRERGTMIVLN